MLQTLLSACRDLKINQKCRRGNSLSPLLRRNPGLHAGAGYSRVAIKRDLSYLSSGVCSFCVEEGKPAARTNISPMGRN